MRLTGFGQTHRCRYEINGSVLARDAGLPLAVRIAGARLASRPAWSVAHLGARLADQRGRLGELSVGDLAVRFSHSCATGTVTNLYTLRAG